MKVAVMNPPKGLTRPRLYKRGRKYFRGKKSHLPSRMKLANPKRKRRRLSALARRAALRNLRKARAVVRKSVRRKHVRRRRYQNPFQGTLMTLNPSRKNLKKRYHRRKTVMAHKRKKHRRHHYSNPAMSTFRSLVAAPKEMISSSFIMEAAGTAVGFVAPTMVLNQIPATWRAAKWQTYAWKVGAVAALSAAAGFVNKRVQRFVLVGGGVSLLLDLYAEFMGGGMSAPAPAPGTKIYTGIGPGSSGMRIYTGAPGMPGAEAAGLSDAVFEVY